MKQKLDSKIFILILSMNTVMFCVQARLLGTIYCSSPFSIELITIKNKIKKSRLMNKFD